MGLKSRISKRQILLTCAAFTIFSYASTSHAGFEWVPKETPKINAADMAVENAPVTPVMNESLNAPQQMMEPAPNSGMMPNDDMDAKADMAVQDAPQALTVKEATIKTMDFSNPSAEQNSDVMLPAPTEVNSDAPKQAKAIAVQELEQSETQIDLPSETTTNVTDNTVQSDAPISLVPSTQPQPNEQIVIKAPEPAADDIIEPFPVKSSHATAPMPTVAHQAPVMAPQVQQPIAPTTKEIVHGFGKNMPLALAVQQIVPEDHAFSFSSNVDIAQRVEWNGGQSWDVVLKETLWPVNLDAYITGNKVVIHSMAPKMEKTSAAEMPLSTTEAQMIAVEPAAGTEMPEASAPSIVEQNSVTLPPKRATIQDPGEMEQTSSLEDKIEMKVDTVGDSVESQAQWSAVKGDSLKSTLFSWSEKSDMQIIWEVSHDFTLEENFSFQGSSKDAFKLLLEMEKRSGKDIYVRYIDDPQFPGNLAMVIVQDNEQAMQKQKEAQQAG